MRKNNIIKIAEIGLNHLGSEVIAKKYLNYLINTNVDGISFQIKNEDFNKKFQIATNKNKTNDKIKKFFLEQNEDFKYFFLEVIKNNKIKKLTLSNTFYKYAIERCKKRGKLIGFAVQDHKKIKFLETQNIDFYKILNADINNTKLLKKISKNKNALKIISVSDNRISEIKKTIKQINQNSKTIISVTDFNKKLNPKSLKKIKEYKKIFNLRVGYGNHSEIKNISRAIRYKPELLLVYVKLDDKSKLPDTTHAINLKSLEKIYKD